MVNIPGATASTTAPGAVASDDPPSERPADLEALAVWSDVNPRPKPMRALIANLTNVLPSFKANVYNILKTTRFMGYDGFFGDVEHMIIGGESSSVDPQFNGRQIAKILLILNPGELSGSGDNGYTITTSAKLDPNNSRLTVVNFLLSPKRRGNGRKEIYQSCGSSTLASINAVVEQGLREASTVLRGSGMTGTVLDESISPIGEGDTDRFRRVFNPADRNYEYRVMCGGLLCSFSWALRSSTGMLLLGMAPDQAVDMPGLGAAVATRLYPMNLVLDRGLSSDRTLAALRLLRRWMEIRFRLVLPQEFVLMVQQHLATLEVDPSTSILALWTTGFADIMLSGSCVDPLRNTPELASSLVEHERVRLGTALAWLMDQIAVGSDDVSLTKLENKIIADFFLEA